MEFPKLLKILNNFAPLNQAESWDNVGLLIEPSNCASIDKILITNDLTTKVLQEAIDEKAQCIVSYHPPLFSSFKRLTQSDTKQRIAIQCIEHNIAVFSHHTAIDAKNGGVNDWLVSGLGNVKESKPIHQAMELNKQEELKIVTFVPVDHFEKVRSAMCNAGAGNIGEYSQCSFVTNGTGSFLGSKSSNPAYGEKGKLEKVEEFKLEMVCSKSSLSNVILALKQAHPYEEAAYDIFELQKKPVFSTGMGRVATLQDPTPLRALIEKLKLHLGVDHLRVATALNAASLDDVTIRTVGVCAGSGASLLRGTRCDLWLTGEAGHHEVLAAVESGTSVILAEHSNSERGYLRNTMVPELQAMVGNEVKVVFAKKDQDPLKVE